MPDKITFKRSTVEIVFFILLIFALLGVIVIGVTALDLLPHEVPPSEPFEYPKE